MPTAKIINIIFYVVIIGLVGYFVIFKIIILSYKMRAVWIIRSFRNGIEFYKSKPVSIYVVKGVMKAFLDFDLLSHVTRYAEHVKTKKCLYWDDVKDLKEII